MITSINLVYGESRDGNGLDLDRIMHNPTPTLQEVEF